MATTLSRGELRKLYSFLKRSLQISSTGKAPIDAVAGMLSHIISLALADDRETLLSWISRREILDSWIAGHHINATTRIDRSE